MKSRSSVFLKSSVIQEFQSVHHTLSQAQMSSSACFPVNTSDSQVWHSLSPLGSNSDAYKGSLLHFFSGSLTSVFHSNPKAGSRRLRKLASSSLPRTHFSSWLDDSTQHSSEVGASGVETAKTKEKWWCTSIQGMCNKVTTVSNYKRDCSSFILFFLLNSGNLFSHLYWFF